MWKSLLTKEQPTTAKNKVIREIQKYMELYVHGT
jgi:hypothetical protein